MAARLKTVRPPWTKRLRRKHGPTKLPRSHRKAGLENAPTTRDRCKIIRPLRSECVRSKIGCAQNPRSHRTRLHPDLSASVHSRHNYDHSAAIWSQNTTASRLTGKNLYDANLAVYTIRKKSVTPNSDRKAGHENARTTTVRCKIVRPFRSERVRSQIGYTKKSTLSS